MSRYSLFFNAGTYYRAGALLSMNADQYQWAENKGGWLRAIAGTNEKHCKYSDNGSSRQISARNYELS